MDALYELPSCNINEREARYQKPKSYVNLPAPRPSPSPLQNDITCDYRTTADVAPPNTSQTSTAHNRREEKKVPSKWKLFAVAAAIFQIFVIVIAVLIAVKVHQPIVTQQMDAAESSQVQGSNHDYPKTCLELRERGQSRSGYYVIQPADNEAPFSTYCDMETSGGGWTLIASVHENNINGKCTTADIWMSDDYNDDSTLVSRNWENNNTFGNAKQATSNDYKNSGYYSIKASDVMMRHTPNEAEITNSKQSALLEYHTENGFLKQHGGNLYSVYHDEYSLQTKSLSEMYFTKNHKEMLDALVRKASNIISGIPNFYHYTYDSSLTSSTLSNAGPGMFNSYGMQVYSAYPCGLYLVYGKNYTCSSYLDIHVASRRSIPFFALMTIGNNNIDRRTSTFYYRVRSYRPSTDRVQTYSGTLSNGNFTMNYNAYCRYQSYTSIPSLCDIFYAVSNVQLWKSSSFDFQTLSTSLSSSYYYAHQYIRNSPRNIVFGYTMFSWINGTLISQNSIESALTKMLAIFATFQSVAQSCDEGNLIEPVRYTVGGVGVLGTIPTSLRDDVTTGYMQFRARNRDGAVFAFCPAIRVKTCKADNLCIGGVFQRGSNTIYCSDYTNWNAGYNIEDINEFNPGSSYRSQHFIQSTMLMFYR